MLFAMCVLRCITYIICLVLSPVHQSTNGSIYGRTLAVLLISSTLGAYLSVAFPLNLFILSMWMLLWWLIVFYPSLCVFLNPKIANCHFGLWALCHCQVQPFSLSLFLYTHAFKLEPCLLVASPFLPLLFVQGRATNERRLYERESQTCSEESALTFDTSSLSKPCKNKFRNVAHFPYLYLERSLSLSLYCSLRSMQLSSKFRSFPLSFFPDRWTHISVLKIPRE